MSRQPIVVAVGAVALVALGAVSGVWWAHRSPERGTHAANGSGATAAVSAQPAPDRKVLYWYDPMYPQQKFDKPGKSPYMNMDLVPKYADEAGAGGVAVSSQIAQSLGIRTAVAEKGRIENPVEAVGTVAFDERAVALVQARTAGYIERLYVRAPLDPVRKGQALALLFVPEWAGAQQEYLALKASAMPGAKELAAAARNRLLLLGMTEAQVAAVDREGRPVTRVTLASPVDGVVGELTAREGMNVMAGAALFRLNGLSTVWVNVDIPEALAAAVRPGAAITATVPAYPGESFQGKVAAVLPDVNATTRTLRARVELANRGARLKPGMFATVNIASPEAREVVLVPSEAVIVTGERSVVIVEREAGRFEPVNVKIGREQAGRTEILSGLEPGAKVVASGQFLIDSEASLRGVERRMASNPAAPSAAPDAAHHAEGRLEQVRDGMLTISHGSVPELKWPAMTMDFAAPKTGMPQGLKAGDRIAFDFVQKAEGEYQVTKVERKGGAS